MYTIYAQWRLAWQPVRERFLSPFIYRITLGRARRLPAHFLHYRILFIHVPRTGGTSLAASLLKACHLPQHLQWKEDALHLPVHFYLRTLGKAYTHFFSFAFVRHPLTRIYSAYCYFREAKQFQNTWLRWLTREYAPTFDAFIRKVLIGVRHQLVPAPAFLPQTYFLQVVSSSGAHFCPVHFIGRYESLTEDYQRLRQILYQHRQIRLPEALPHENASSAQNVSLAQIKAMLSMQNLRLFLTLYQSDFITFGYTL